MLKLVVVAIFLIGCHTSASTVKFIHTFLNEESVVIKLSDYGLDEVPPEIHQLRSVKKLTITRESLPTGWTIYPPQSPCENQTFKPPFHRLPDEITELTQLTALRLIGLDLVALPANFHHLKNLDTLDLAFNKLTIKQELATLKSLQQLKFLALFGNKATSADVIELKKAIPGLVVDIYNEE